jgi:transcriptional regulator with XRE-family HTH domain
MGRYAQKREGVFARRVAARWSPHVLVTLRDERKMSQAELARETGFTQSCIARLELGVRSARIDELEVIAEALGLSVVELIERGLGRPRRL